MIPARKLEYLEELYPEVKKTKPRSRRKKKKKSLPETVIICSFAFIFVMVSFLFLIQKINMMRLNVTLAQVRQEYHSVVQQHEFLQLELIAARSLSNIEQLARNELGMIEPETKNIVVMRTPTTQDKPTFENTIREQNNSGGVFEIVADWINRILPLGGVQAGRIGN